MRPLVGSSAKGVLSHDGISVPSGFFLADVHLAMSMSAVSALLTHTLMRWPRASMVMRFHSPALRTVLLAGARWPKMAPHCQLLGDLAHFSAKSSAIWTSTEWGIQFLVSVQ